VSDFILNLARRGAGLAPVVALQPPFTPASAPDVGTAHATEPRSERAPRDEDRPELQVRVEPPSSQAQVSPAAAPPSPVPAPPTPPPPQARTSPLPPPAGISDVAPAQEPVPQPTEPAVPRPEEESAYPTTAAEPQSSPLQHTRPPAPLTAPMPRAEPAVQISGEPFSPAPSRPAAQPQPTPLPTQPETNLAAMPTAVRPTLAHETRGASEGETVAHVQPATPPMTPARQAIIKPAPASERPFALPTMMGPTVTPSEPRPIQVRIGTIEVRATTPPAPTPPPAPKPQGFDNYLALRTYANREDY
jgi:hypothetical protein